MRIASVEVVARLLSERLSESGAPGRAVTVSQLLERVLPYALVRERLGLAGKAEYDLAVLRLLSDRVLLQVDPALQEAAARELDEPEPGLRAIEKLADSLLRLRDPARRDRMDGTAEAEGAAPSDEGSESEDAGASVEGSEPDEIADRGDAPDSAWLVERPTPSADALPPAETAPMEPSGKARGGRCWSCTARLPRREGVRFCPHCGVDQQAARCTSCGDRLEPGWSYCPRCGGALARP